MKNTKTLILASIIALGVGEVALAKDSQKQKDAEEIAIARLTLQRYNAIFGGDESLFERCDFIDASNREGIFTCSGKIEVLANSLYFSSTTGNNGKSLQ